MGRHYANDNWLNEMAKTDEYACRDLATEVNEMTDGRQTYNAVFGFLPGGTSTRPRNVSIASLMRLYCAERSGHKEDARREIKLRFHYLDYTIQKKILRLFLDGSKQDRLFCFKQIRHSWDKVFEPKLIELWEMHCEPECANLLVKYGNIDYVRRHQEELAKSAGYYPTGKRLALEDRNFVIEKEKLEGPAMYVRLLYETKRTIGTDEATDILWWAIDRSLLQGIRHQCNIAPYFLVYDGRLDSDGLPLETIVPSIVWDDNVMECMRYLYHIAPKAVVAEALRRDMEVRKLFYRLVGGKCYNNSSDPSADRRHDMQIFCKLAYAMFPEDKRKYAAENDCRTDTSGLSAASWDNCGCHEDESSLLDWRVYANRSSTNLLETIREYRLTEEMTPEEWKTLYIEKNIPNNSAFTLLSKRLSLEPDCPSREEFITKLLS